MTRWIVVAAFAAFASPAAHPLSAQDPTERPKLYPPHASCCVVDLAHVLAPADSATIDRTLRALKDSTHFNVAVVTLPSLAGQDPNDVALQIGRDWGIGSTGAYGDPRRARGLVILLVPRTASHSGQIATQLARGAEGIFTDADIGEIRRRALDDFRAARYGAGLLKIVAGIQPRIYADLTSSTTAAGSSLPIAEAPPATRVTGPAPPFLQRATFVLRALPWAAIIVLIVLILIVVIGIRKSGISWGSASTRRKRRGSNDSNIPDTSGGGSSSSSDSASSSSDSSSSSFDGGGDFGGGGGSDSF